MRRQVGAACGGVRKAVVQAPVEAGVQYFVIVDGMTDYVGDFNVTFSARPLETMLDWQARARRHFTSLPLCAACAARTAHLQERRVPVSTHHCG